MSPLWDEYRDSDPDMNTCPHLAPQLSPLMVDERVPQVSDHQLPLINTEEQTGSQLLHLRQVSLEQKTRGSGVKVKNT